MAKCFYHFGHSKGALEPGIHFNSEVIRSVTLSRDGRPLVMNSGTAIRDVVLIRNVR